MTLMGFMREDPQGCVNKESESDIDSARATSCRLELIFPWSLLQGTHTSTLEREIGIVES